MCDNSEAGPSKPKKARLLYSRRKKCTTEALEEILEAPSSDDSTDCDISDGNLWECESSSTDTDSANDDCDFDNNQENVTQNVINTFRNTGDINWITTSSLQSIEFSVNPGVCVIMLTTGKPIDYFCMLMDDHLLNLITTETNEYAKQLKSRNTKQKARISEWKDINKEELLIFIGLTLHMGNLKLNRIRDYWSTHRLYNIPYYHDFMARNRYMGILRCLHFARNAVVGDSTPNDRLYKLRPLIDFFNNKMRNIYTSNKHLSIDVSMVLWRGRLVFRQYIKNKKHKYSIKLYLLTESDGTIIKFAIYTGASNVVLNLLEDFQNHGYSVYMDNFYNSYNLSQQLLETKTYSTGTLRGNRKGNPSEVIKAKLQRGETVCRYSNGVCVGKWRDKRDVLYITTEHVNELIETTNRRGQQKMEPKPVAEYNKDVSGIDLKDQMLAYYPCARRTIRWYKKIGIRIIETMLLNSQKLYQKCANSKMSLLDFRMKIIEDLLPENKSKSSQQQKSKETHQREQHFMAKCASSEQGRTLRKKCRHCSNKNIRKDTMFYCKTCPDQPGFCFDCFEVYHS